ncbi:MAG: hypothetical protein OJF62_000803 [Pseudolabrys sp.]|jgi:hypothetical protein|nr:hypothetical protein [Pseudolabrys sp.]
MKYGFPMATALAVVLAAGAAQAQTTIVTQPVQTETVVTQPPLVLTPVQRETIYRTIVRHRPAVTVAQAPATVEYRVGMRVPQDVTLYPVPQTVVEEVPAVRNYRYMVINDRAWLVDPATSEIVAEVGD